MLSHKIWLSSNTALEKSENLIKLKVIRVSMLSTLLIASSNAA
jgi:hypothetical protein